MERLKINVFLIILYAVLLGLNSNMFLAAEDDIEAPTVRNVTTVRKRMSRVCIVNGVRGRCVSPHLCFSTNPYIKGIVHPLKCSQSHRSGKKSHRVCCTDCYLVSNSSNVVLDGKGRLLWKTGQKPYDKCLEWLQRLDYPCPLRSWLVRSVVNRTRGQCHIYSPSSVSPAGGEDVMRGEFPHMALLGYRNSTKPTDWLCSGSLVSERFVLTAAHCLNSELGPVTEIAVGLLKRSDPEEYWQRYRVGRAIPHPLFKSPHKYHDIALLETEIPVQFKNGVRPACLPPFVPLQHYENPIDRVLATGWGALGRHSGLADTMQKVSLERFNELECSTLYPVHRHMRSGIDPNLQMCYGHHQLIRDTCGGDSGGPLHYELAIPACIWTVLGVTSFGHNCGTIPSAGVYTRVQMYELWIESIVLPDS